MKFDAVIFMICELLLAHYIILSLNINCCIYIPSEGINEQEVRINN